MSVVVSVTTGPEVVTISVDVLTLHIMEPKDGAEKCVLICLKCSFSVDGGVEMS